MCTISQKTNLARSLNSTRAPSLSSSFSSPSLYVSSHHLPRPNYNTIMADAPTHGAVLGGDNERARSTKGLNASSERRFPLSLTPKLFCDVFSLQLRNIFPSNPYHSTPHTHRTLHPHFVLDSSPLLTSRSGSKWSGRPRIVRSFPGHTATWSKDVAHLNITRKILRSVNADILISHSDDIIAKFLYLLFPTT